MRSQRRFASGLKKITLRLKDRVDGAEGGVEGALHPGVGEGGVFAGEVDAAFGGDEVGEDVGLLAGLEPAEAPAVQGWVSQDQLAVAGEDFGVEEFGVNFGEMLDHEVGRAWRAGGRRGGGRRGPRCSWRA